jgi:hypothetical protein
MNRIRHYAALGLLSALLTACQSLGLAPAQSLDQRLAYGYSTYSAVQFAAANAKNAGEISASDAEAVLKLADQSRVLLDGAKVLLATDPNGAATKLGLAVAILTELQSQLRKRA